MPATIYAVAGGKGGVGNTTTAANLAATFRATGREVLLVDADLAMSNLQDMIGLSHEPTLHDVLGGGAALSDAIIHESEDVLDTEGRLDILPGSTELDAFATADPTQLPDTIERIAPEYDTIILDTASGVTPETAIPLQIADRTLIMTTPDEAAIQDAVKTVNLVEHAGSKVAGLVISRTCLGLDDEEIVERVGIEHLATIPDLNTPGVNPLTPYRRLAVRLLIGREIATDPATVLDIDPGETPRITSTLEPTPEPAETDETSSADADADAEPSTPAESSDAGFSDADETGFVSPLEAEGAEFEVTADGGSIEGPEEPPAEAEEPTAEAEPADEESASDDATEAVGSPADADEVSASDDTVTVDTDEGDDVDTRGRLGRFVKSLSGPSSQ